MTAHRLPAVGRVGEGQPSRRRAFIPADCWRSSIAAALTTAGAIACLAALYGVAVLTKPLGALLYALSIGAH